MLNSCSRDLGLVIVCAVLFSIVKTAVATSCPLFPTFFFNQTLDHYLNSSSPFDGVGTFQQQYELNTTYFRPGGPILFIQSGEGPLFCVEDTVFWDWAKEIGATVASLEHRYFGLSLPDGFNATTATPSQYAYLTMNNTLLDAVNFVAWIKKTVPDAANSEAIVMGRSYAGTLTTLLRVHYPEVFFGAIPCAPLLRSFGPEASNPDKNSWWEYVSEVYTEVSFEAAMKIKTAMNYFQTALSPAGSSTTQNFTSLIQEMDLCEPYPQTLQAWKSIYSALFVPYDVGTQYNYASAASNPFNISRPLQAIIKQTLAANSTGAVLRAPLQLYTLEPADQCLYWNSSRFSSSSVGLSLAQFERVECLMFPGSTSDIPPGTIFPPQSGTGNVTALCLALGLDPSFALKSNKEIIEYYRFTREDLMSTKRLLFTQAGYDPTTSVGPPPFPLAKNANDTRTVLMYGNSHGEEIYSETVDSSEQVKLIHLIMKNTIKAWLGRIIS